MAYSKGRKMEWDWGNGAGTGTVETTYAQKITRKLQGPKVTRGRL